MSSFTERIKHPELSLKKEAGMSPSGDVTTEFSMWLLDSVAINHIMTTISSSSYDVCMGDKKALFQFFYSMKEMWDRLRVIVKKEATKIDMDNRITKMDKRIIPLRTLQESNSQWFLPNDVLMELQEIKRNLIQLKQDVGLGIPWAENYTDGERIRNALR